MSDAPQTTGRDGQERDERLRYVPPTVTELGRVSALTLGGRGSGRDSNSRRSGR